MGLRRMFRNNSRFVAREGLVLLVEAEELGRLTRLRVEILFQFLMFWQDITMEMPLKHLKVG